QVLLSSGTVAVAARSLPEGTALVDAGKRSLGGARPEAVHALVGPDLPAVATPLLRGAAAPPARRRLLLAAGATALLAAAVTGGVFVSRGGAKHAALPPLAVPGPSPRPVLFESNRSGRFDIYAMDPSGDNQRLLLKEPLAAAIANAQPVLSPDGKRILF